MSIVLLGFVVTLANTLECQLRISPNRLIFCGFLAVFVAVPPGGPFYTRLLMLTTGVDIGGTKVFAALVDEDGSILGRAAHATDPDAGTASIIRALDELFSSAAAAGGAGGGSTALRPA